MNRKIILVMSLILAVFSLTLGLSYAFFTQRIAGDNDSFVITSGNLDLIVNSSTINASMLMPIYDSEANTKAYTHTFSIQRGENASLDGCYDLYLVIDKIGSNLKNKYLKYRISDGTYTYEGNFAPSSFNYVGDTATIKIFSNHELSSISISHNFTLKLWLSYSEVEDQSFILRGTDEDRTIEAHLEASGNLGSCTSSNNKYLVNEITKNKTIETRSDFSTTFIENTDNKIFTTDRTDDDSVVYYYAGNTHNNWVIFGDNGSGTYYYWRIIRTNSNEEGGGVRLLYSGSGTSASTIPSNLTNAIAFSSVFNSIYNKSEYVGYMYTVGEQHGHGTNSTIKTNVDNWYISSNLKSFEDYLNADAVYCSDRSVPTGVTWESTPSTSFIHAGYTRVLANYPTYKCGGNSLGDYYESVANRLADKFSKTSNGGGNGYLINPIGLITTDELYFAGGKYSANNSNVWYALNNNESSITGTTWWWAGSPVFWNSGSTNVFGSFVYGSQYPGRLDYAYVNHTNPGVRPVISLKSSVLVSSGEGTVSSPYIISTDL